MKTQPRPYQGSADLKELFEILIRGHQSTSLTYYIHTGDLKWWLFYLDNTEPLEEKITLWEDACKNVIGWVLFSKRFQTFDVFLHPSVRLSETGIALYNWAIEEIGARVQAWGGGQVTTMWVSEKDGWLIEHLEQCGFFQSNSQYLYMERNLQEPLPSIPTPHGYSVRSLQGAAEAKKLAVLSHAAFDSQKEFDAYLENYTAFLQSAVCCPEHIWVSEDSRGAFGSFAIGWLEAPNHLGHFEPVAVHPQHRRRGLGKAVVLEGLQMMQAAGMQNAGICVEKDNMSAHELYRALGFRDKIKLFTFSKNLS